VILTPRIVLRIALLVLAAVILQVSFFAQMPLLGSVANLIPVVIVALGLLGGAVQGAVAGFAAGLLLDSLIGGTLGISALALMAAGYLAGRWRETYDIVSSLVPPLLSGALSGVAAFAYAMLTKTHIRIAILTERLSLGQEGGNRLALEEAEMLGLPEEIRLVRRDRIDQMHEHRFAAV
jgi:rod shape-determining protein MreD